MSQGGFFFPLELGKEIRVRESGGCGELVGMVVEGAKEVVERGTMVQNSHMS